MSLKIRTSLLSAISVGILCTVMSGCQSYDRYALQIRDEAGAPVGNAHVSVDYGLELDRMFKLFKPSLKPSEVTTDKEGCALVKVARNEDWRLLIYSAEESKPEAPSYDLTFHPPAVPDHSFGMIKERDGWFVSRNFWTKEDGPLVRIALVP